MLIQALAGEVKNYRRAPGDFAEWRKANPNFDPTKCARLQDAMMHVLEYALRGLDERLSMSCVTIAAFRMPARLRYPRCVVLTRAAEKQTVSRPNRELDAALTELEDRGLLGWDRRANRYDMHPIVRGVAWNGLDPVAQQGVYAGLHDHFESLPKIDSWQQVESLEDLTPAIELYNTLIGLGRYDDAEMLVYEPIRLAMLYRLSASRQLAELLEELFPDGQEHLPRLSKPRFKLTYSALLAQAYLFSGQPGRAIPIFQLPTKSGRRWKLGDPRGT